MPHSTLILYVVQRIKDLRKRKGLRQVELAERIGLSARHFQKVESGDIDLKTSTVSQIAKTLGVPACYLFRAEPLSGAFPCPVEILDMLTVGVRLSNASGRVVYANRTYTNSLGLGMADLRDSLGDAGEESELRNYLSQVVASRRKPSPYFTKIRSKGGDVIPVRVDCQCILDDAGAVQCLLSVIHYHPSW